ncbi:hypothetical protein HQ590_02920 [bacterium]|nr:hypothetical protein [bacterium]
MAELCKKLHCDGSGGVFHHRKAIGCLVPGKALIPAQPQLKGGAVWLAHLDGIGVGRHCGHILSWL